ASFSWCSPSIHATVFTVAAEGHATAPGSTFPKTRSSGEIVLRDADARQLDPRASVRQEKDRISVEPTSDRPVRRTPRLGTQLGLSPFIVPCQVSRLFWRIGSGTIWSGSTRTSICWTSLAK